MQLVAWEFLLRNDRKKTVITICVNFRISRFSPGESKERRISDFVKSDDSTYSYWRNKKIAIYGGETSSRSRSGHSASTLDLAIKLTDVGAGRCCKNPLNS